MKYAVVYLTGAGVQALTTMVLVYFGMLQSLDKIMQQQLLTGVTMFILSLVFFSLRKER